METIMNFLQQTGFSMIPENWKMLVMIAISLVLAYLAIVKKFEPLLLLPISFGMLLTNLPGAEMFHEQLFAGGHVNWDLLAGKTVEIDGVATTISAGLIDYLYLGVKLGIVQKSGAWFNYGDIRLGQGRDNAKQFLRDNPEIANDIEGQVRANADKLYATRRPGGKAAAAPAEGEPAAPATAKEPVVKAPARSSESELDIMVEE